MERRTLPVTMHATHGGGGEVAARRAKATTALTGTVETLGLLYIVRSFNVNDFINPEFLVRLSGLSGPIRSFKAKIKMQPFFYY